MTWEVAVTVAPELEPAISALLEAAGSQGVVVEDAGSRAVFDQEAPFERCRVVGYFAPGCDRAGIEAQLRATLPGAAGDNPVTWQAIAERDWQEAWKEHFQPLPVGESLLILPTWREVPAGNRRLIIRMDPEMAFGSGGHETTRGCLQALEREARRGPLGRVLDMGTGSGILAIGAALLGAERIIATDLDPVAVATCAKNARLNGVAERIHAQRNDTVPPGPFQLILANILAPVLVAQAEPLAAALAPGGRVILSGLLLPQIAEVTAACRQAGLEIIGEDAIGEWAVITAGKGRNE